MLEELENIDDELDETGIIFVTTEDVGIAKKHGIKSYPALVFFRNKMPLVYKGSLINPASRNFINKTEIIFICNFIGDLGDEDEILAWLTDEDTMEIPGRIEEVNSRMLEKIIGERSLVVVFFCKFFFFYFPCIGHLHKFQNYKFCLECNC